MIKCLEIIKLKHYFEIKNYKIKNFTLCPREESNLDLRIRSPPFYPLNYRGVFFTTDKVFYH